MGVGVRRVVELVCPDSVLQLFCKTLWLGGCNSWDARMGQQAQRRPRLQACARGQSPLGSIIGSSSSVMAYA